MTRSGRKRATTRSDVGDIFRTFSYFLFSSFFLSLLLPQPAAKKNPQEKKRSYKVLIKDTFMSVVFLKLFFRFFLLILNVLFISTFTQTCCTNSAQWKCRWDSRNPTRKKKWGKRHRQKGKRARRSMKRRKEQQINNMECVFVENAKRFLCDASEWERNDEKNWSWDCQGFFGFLTSTSRPSQRCLHYYFSGLLWGRTD